MLTEALDSFPPPEIYMEVEGGLTRTSWLFRGHKDSKYRLEPSVERAADGKSISWSALELMILEEFKSKARTYIRPAELPSSDDTLGWLALMQHYGIPTRLLDFTYSPYVALYFAIRGRSKTEGDSPAAVWAIDSEALVLEAFMNMDASPTPQPATHTESERPDSLEPYSDAAEWRAQAPIVVRNGSKCTDRSWS